MAIYRKEETFFVNGVADFCSKDWSRSYKGHRIRSENMKALSRTYHYALLFQSGLVIPIILFALIPKYLAQPMTFAFICALALLVATPVFVIWASTLYLRSEVAIFTLAEVMLERRESLFFYGFYLISGLNLLVTYLSAPWQAGWAPPIGVLPPVVLFLCVLLAAAYKLVVVRLRAS